MKNIFLIILLSAVCVFAQAQSSFIVANGKHLSCSLPDGRAVGYTAYEKLYYVSHVEDSLCQYLNIYVPDNVQHDSPIILRTNSSQLRSSVAGGIQGGDFSALALSRGMVVCVAGIRGVNSFQVNNITRVKRKKTVLMGQEIVYTGKMPTPVLDLKAAISYLHAHDSEIPGRGDRIVAVGFPAQAQLMALVGVSGFCSDFAPMLRDMGAANGGCNVFATAVVQPVFMCAGQYDVDSLAKGYRGDSFLKSALLNSVRSYAADGKTVPDSLGAVYFADTQITDDMLDYIVDFDLGSFARCIAGHPRAEFPLLDTAYEFAGGQADTLDMVLRRKLSDPFSLLSADMADCRHWYIRHSVAGGDRMFPFSLLLAEKLLKNGADVDFRIGFDRQPARRAYYTDILDWIEGL